MSKVFLADDDLKNSAEMIKKDADDIKVELYKIVNAANEISGVWKDSNAKIYLNKFNELSANFDGFYEELYAFGAFLNSVVKAYQEEYTIARTSVNGRQG